MIEYNAVLSWIEVNMIPLSIGLGVLLIILLLLLLSRPLRDDLKCKAIIKDNSQTFYKAFSKVKNRHKRKAIYAVYAFCRVADDLVDEYHDEAKLNKLEKELTLYISKGKTPNFFWRSLKKHTKAYYTDFDYKPFYDMIKGQRLDLSFKGYETTEALLEYCYYVAGTVGLMLTPILSYENRHELKDFSINLGYAMQITNILRDIGEDYKNNRIYLPKALMLEANYKHDDLSNGKINDRFIVMFEKLAKIAETHFEQALKDVRLFQDDARLPLAFSIILYRAILDQIRHNGYDVFKKRAVVPTDKKQQLIEQYLKTLKS